MMRQHKHQQLSLLGELSLPGAQVRSCTLDTWLPEQVDFMARTGNEVANAYREARLEPAQRPSTAPLELESFIRRKVGSNAVSPSLRQAPCLLTEQQAALQLGCCGGSHKALGLLLPGASLTNVAHCVLPLGLLVRSDQAWVRLAMQRLSPTPPECSPQVGLAAVWQLGRPLRWADAMQYNGDFAEGTWPPPDTQQPPCSSRSSEPFNVAVGGPSALVKSAAAVCHCVVL